MPDPKAGVQLPSAARECLLEFQMRDTWADGGRKQTWSFLNVTGSSNECFRSDGRLTFTACQELEERHGSFDLFGKR